MSSLSVRGGDGAFTVDVLRSGMPSVSFLEGIVVLNNALQKDQQNLELLKDLSFNYYLNRNYAKGETIAKSLIELHGGQLEIASKVVEHGTSGVKTVLSTQA